MNPKRNLLQGANRLRGFLNDSYRLLKMNNFHSAGDLHVSMNRCHAEAFLPILSSFKWAEIVRTRMLTSVPHRHTNMPSGPALTRPAGQAILCLSEDNQA